MPYTYIAVDTNTNSLADTLQIMGSFGDFYCIGTAGTNEEALEMVLEKRPFIVFLALDTSGDMQLVSLELMHRLFQYLDHLPHFIILADSEALAYQSIKVGAFDYLLQPLKKTEFTKSILRIRKLNREVATERTSHLPDTTGNPPATITHGTPVELDGKMCIKSYGDYQFISLSEIVYLKADNNTTDFHLSSGRKLTAYKTLKHYEQNLPAHFYRIHNSYIVNSNYITRISTGKSLCYLNGNDVAVSFSKTYRDIIDILVRNISSDYL